MNTTERLDIILTSYKRYYNIKKGKDVLPPFAAEAVFHSHDEQYILVKSAKLSELESREYAFFATEERLDAERAAQLDEKAWNEGLSRVVPHRNHRNTDITLVIVAETVTKEAVSFIKKLYHYKSYRMGLQGWSNYRIVVLENSSGLLTYNRRGRELKKLYQKIIKNSYETKVE